MLELTTINTTELANKKLGTQLNRNQKLLTKNQHNVMHQAHILQF